MNISSILPETKDFTRVKAFDWYVHGNRNWFYGSGAPISSNAEKMAKLITDTTKLVRRAKAVAAIWGTRDYTGFSNGIPKTENAWKPFDAALRREGFSSAEIAEISRYNEVRPGF